MLVYFEMMRMNGVNLRKSYFLSVYHIVSSTAVYHDKFLCADIPIYFKVMGVACKHNALWPQVADMRCPVFSGCRIHVTLP